MGPTYRSRSSRFLPVRAEEVRRWVVDEDFSDELAWEQRLRAWARAELMPRRNPNDEPARMWPSLRFHERPRSLLALPAGRRAGDGADRRDRACRRRGSWRGAISRQVAGRRPPHPAAGAAADGAGLLPAPGAGASRLIGHWLEHTLGITVVFHWSGAVIASAVAAFPLFLLPARGAFEAVDPALEDVARLLGRSERSVFLAVTLPLAWRGLAAGIVLAFARSLGDFGATLMVAGNIPGLTQTAVAGDLRRHRPGQRPGPRRPADALDLAASRSWRFWSSSAPCRRGGSRGERTVVRRGPGRRG